MRHEVDELRMRNGVKYPVPGASNQSGDGGMTGATNDGPPRVVRMTEENLRPNIDFSGIGTQVRPGNTGGVFRFKAGGIGTDHQVKPKRSGRNKRKKINRYKVLHGLPFATPHPQPNQVDKNTQKWRLVDLADDDDNGMLSHMLLLEEAATDCCSQKDLRR